MLRGIHKYLDKSNWEDARKVVDNDDMSSVGGFGQWTPHHIACKRDAPVDIMKSLIARSPESLDKFDACNRLPLHYAAECGVSTRTIELIVEACPKSILGVDNEMKTPLHLLLQNSTENGKIPPVEVVKILSSDPSSVWIADSNEKMPIHYAAELIDHLPTEHFQALVEADHNTVLAQTKGGMTALHIALKFCTKEIPVRTIKSLLGLTVSGEERLDADYEVTRIMSDEDLLPLHYACQNHTMISEEIFHLFLERCPEGASTSTDAIGFPLDVLESSLAKYGTRSDTFNRKSDMIFAYNTSLLPYCKQDERLRRIGDNILTDLSKNGWLSAINKSLWIWMCTLPEDENDTSVVAEVIASVLKRIKDSEQSRFLITIQTISEDEIELPLFELASPKIKEIMSPYFLVGKRFGVKKTTMTVTHDTIKFDAIDNRQNGSEVVVRLIADKQKFEDQVLLHQNVQAMSANIGLPPPIVPMIAKYDIKSDEAIFNDFQDFVNYDDIIDMTAYHYILIQEAPGKDLSSFLDKNDKENQMNCKALAHMILCLHNAGYAVKKLGITNLCQKNGKIMLHNSNSLINLTSASREMFFGEVNDLDTSRLPPEMIAKLTSDEVKQYETYWKQVMNDYQIASEFCEEDLRESTKFQAYLREHDCSIESFWSRVHYNHHLWQKIRPRCIGDDYFVIKCFRCDSKGYIYSADSLPYELVQRDKSLEVWFFASFLFEQLSGETLFHTDKNHIFINDDDYEKLHNWNMSNPRSAHRMQNVTDPFARDFLRVSLTAASTRLSTMKNVLEHNFFKFCEDDSKYSSIKKGYFALEKVFQEEFLLLEDLNQKTKRLDLVSTEVQLKFEHSIWRQLKWNYKAEEVKFPAGFVFLPYSLEYDETEDRVIASVDDKIAQKLSIAVLDVLHYVNLAQTIKKTSGKGSSPSFQAFQTSNLNAVESQQSKPIPICRDILSLWNNTETLLTRYFESYLSLKQAKAVSYKLVSDTLRGVIDYEKYTNISQCADQAIDAISSLLNAVGNDNHTTHHMLNRYLAEICNGHSLTLETKEHVYQSLSTMFEQFSESPTTAVLSLFDTACLRLLNCYSSEKDCHVYAIDEFEGTPIVPKDFSSRMELTSDAMKAFIPTTLLVAKSHFNNGLDQLFGCYNSDSVVTEQNNCLPGLFSEIDSKNELSIILNSLNDNLRSRRHFDCGQDVLKYLEDYNQKYRSKAKYFGLHRLLSTNNLSIWAKKQSYMIVQVEVQKDLSEAQAAIRGKVLTSKTVSVEKMSRESKWEHNHSGPRTPLDAIKCEANSPQKSQGSSTLFDDNVIDDELMKSVILSTDGSNDLSQGGNAGINQYSSSNSDTITIVTDSNSESDTSVPKQSKSGDTSEVMYYSSTDSEKSEVQSTTERKKNRPSPGKNRARIKTKTRKSKPHPGESRDEYSKREMDQEQIRC